jgi:hypothetical protein
MLFLNVKESLREDFERNAGATMVLEPGTRVGGIR